MGDRSIKLRDFKRILRSYGVAWDKTRGKGSHGVFYKTMAGGVFTYPVPDETQALVCYVRGCRKKFKLTAEDGVSDQDFYGR